MLGRWTVIGVLALAMTAAFTARADDAAMAGLPHKSYTGTIVSLNTNNHLLEVRGVIFSKKFNLGDACDFVLWNQSQGTAGDLQPGEKVKVVYQDSHGVLVAGRVVEQPSREEGMVKAIDPAQGTLTLRSGAFDRNFRLPDDCLVVLRGDKTGTLGDVQTGNYVTVTYETPNDKATVRRIAQTSTTFTGSLTAIDLEARTVKARALFGTKQFNVGDNCAIVVNGKPDGKLSDLRPEERLVFSYNDINGINVVDRIAPASTPQESETTSAQSAPAP